MYIKREMANVIKAGINQVPVLAVIGPRQSGKSTLVKELFKNHIYLDMQDIDLNEFANSDPKGFLNNYKNEHGLILDEVQYATKLFSQIKVEADRDPRAGYYILSGSQNFLLHEKISESLAGRAYFYKLLPLSIKELKLANLLKNDVSEVMVTGFYPKVFQPHVQSKDYYENYIATYIERDIRTIKNIDNILLFNKFIKLCALRIGTQLNVSSLANDCGIAVNTANNWLSLLQSSFILFLLPPYHNNLNRRIIKSPKLYFYDVGLALNLIGLSIEEINTNRNSYGAFFENMVIVDLIKDLYSSNKQYNLSFYRDVNQNEIDLIIETGGKLSAIEIKSSETIQNNIFNNVEWFREQIERQVNSVIIYGGTENQKRSNGFVVSWKNCESIIEKI